jgi:hypothetical protein
MTGLAGEPVGMSAAYDVIVAGGGAAGIGAAVGAAQAGARTLLIERGSFLGGAATLRSVTTYCGLYLSGNPETDAPTQVVFGVAEQILARLRRLGAVTPPQTAHAVYVVFDPEALKITLDGVVADAGVDVIFETDLIDATRRNGNIESVTVSAFGETRSFDAPSFVDATGDAILALHGGAATRYGTDGRAQTGTLGVRYAGIPESIDSAAIHQAITASQAAGIGPLTSYTGLVVRLPGSGDMVAYLADEDVDVRDAKSLSEAERNARAQAWAYLKVFRSLPGAQNARIVTTGPQLGVRESRHILTRKQLSDDFVLSGTQDVSTVAVGAWPVEYHPGAGKPSQWEMVGGPGYYGIPLDALISRDTPNLFAAGRLLDGERKAAASLRVMGTSLATGQATGVAAAHHSRRSLSPAAVQAELQRQDARLPL